MKEETDFLKMEAKGFLQRRVRRGGLLLGV